MHYILIRYYSVNESKRRKITCMNAFHPSTIPSPIPSPHPPIPGPDSFLPVLRVRQVISWRLKSEKKLIDWLLLTYDASLPKNTLFLFSCWFTLSLNFVKFSRSVRWRRREDSSPFIPLSARREALSWERSESVSFWIWVFWFLMSFGCLGLISISY